MPNPTMKFVKRQYTGEQQQDRSIKSRSFHYPEIPRKHEGSLKADTLPTRHSISIWNDVSLEKNIIYQNSLNRTKLTESGKKLRKNWSTSWTVLTHTHLTFFKDQKAFQTLVKCLP